jgi:ankyrin repeat protein
MDSPDLHAAMLWDNKEGFKRLLESGADVTAQNSRGETVLILAAAEHARFFEIILHHGLPVELLRFRTPVTRFSVLMAACENVSLPKEAFARLLDQLPDEDVVSITRYGTSALHYALSRPNKIAVPLLCARGAHIDEKAMVIARARSCAPIHAFLKKCVALQYAMCILYRKLPCDVANLCATFLREKSHIG